MSGITITGLSVFTVRIPVKTIRRQGSGDVSDKAGVVIVKIDTDAGITGWGEAAPWPVFTGTSESCVGALHVHLRPLLIGADPFRIEWLLTRADKAVVHATEAKAAMEMALFDIMGKALKTPVYNLLGGAFRTEIPLSFSIANPDIDADIEVAKELCATGHRIFKVKTGFAGHAEDIRRLEKLRTELPGDVDIRVDYNQGMEVFDAIIKLRDIEAFNPTFIEQPVPMDQVAALAEITRALDTPIMADETVFSPNQALGVAAGRVADLISVKVFKSGGMLRGKEVAAIADAAGIGCYGGSMFETGIAHLAGTHMIAATRNFPLGCEFYQAVYYLKEDLLAEPFPVKEGHVIVPDGPGLGIDVDEDRLAKYTVERLD
jgi:muconate cycloisomerase